MIRLLRIEFRKLKPYKAFWVMLIFYTILLAIMVFGIPGLIDWVAEKSGDSKIRIFKAIVFNFPDIWQNIAYVASLRIFIKMILGLIVIVLITNEFSNLTIRSNIISGLSRGEFLTGKFLLLATLTIFSTIIIFLSGLYLGFTNSSSKDISDVFGKMSFLGGYFIELFIFLAFALFIGILFRKTGFSIIILFAYSIIELILDYKLPDSFSPYLPLNAMNNIIRSPNTSLIKLKSPGFNFDFQEAISFADVGIALVWITIFISLSYFLLKKRDI